MSSRLSPEAPGHVIVAGGGFAAVEALLALRALAGSRVSLELVAADGVLHDRPGATAVPFGAAARTYDLAVLAEHVGATFRRDAVVSVAAREHTVRLASGPTRPYDGLVLALGARSRAGVPGATVFRDQRDAARIAVAVEELCDGRARRIVFAAPVGISWTLPLYELALQTARAVETAGGFAEVTVATPEERPLEAFGEEAAGAVRHLLARH